MNSTGPACSLSPEQLRERREELLPGLFKRADEVFQLPDGLRLLFTSGSGMMAELVRVIEQEQTCCSFLRFRIDVEPSGGPITFQVTGPAGTREMLLAL